METQREILTPAKLRERLAEKREKAKRSWYTLGIPDTGPARRQIHVGGETGYIVLSRLDGDEGNPEPPASMPVQMTSGEAKALKRQGLEVEPTTAPKGEGGLKLKRPKAGASKAAEALAARVAKKKAEEAGKETG